MDGGQVGGFGHFLAFFGQKRWWVRALGGADLVGMGQGQGQGQGQAHWQGLAGMVADADRDTGRGAGAGNGAGSAADFRARSGAPM